MTGNLLSIIIFLPLAALLVLLFLPAQMKNVFRWLTISVTFLQVLLVVGLYVAFETQPELAAADIIDEHPLQFVEKADWIDLDLGALGHLSIDYKVGVDGFSMPMLLLAAIVLFIGAISSWNIAQKEKGYFALYLLLATAIAGTFVALDFFLFYLFFEFMLLPMYFLIGIWGGPRREYAAIKFFLYTLVGSILILIVMIALYVSTFDPVETAIRAGLIENASQLTTQLKSQLQLIVQTNQLAPGHLVHSFDFMVMTDPTNLIPGSVLSFTSGWNINGASIRLIAFIFLLIGFMIKLPAVPFHTWLPDAHVEAPTPISVILAGILLKVGGYGLIRIAYPIFPEGGVYFAWLVGLLGVISIIYGALNALAMKDLKKLIAYSSVSHMGFVLLGIASATSEGVSGAVYQMFSHGLIASMLFLIAGVIYDRTHDRLIDNYSGLAREMPYFTTVVVIAFFASLGLPGFSGFIAELMVFLGAFNSQSINQLLPRAFALIATLGLLLTAAYYLWTLQRMFFGNFYTREKKWENVLKDIDRREYIMFLPLTVLIIMFGIFPHLLINVMNETVNHLISLISQYGFENNGQL